MNRPADKALTRALEVKGDTVEATVNLAPDSTTAPEGEARTLLQNYGLDPDEYVVTGLRSSEWTMLGGKVGKSSRFTFARRGSAAAGVVLPDLDDLHRAVKRDRRKAPAFKAVAESISVLAVLADLQVGKVDARGGVEELLERLEASLEGFRDYCREVKPEEIILFDAGDGIENFESGDGSSDRTNDLSLTEQIRVFRRVLWTWIDEASRLAPSVKVLSVGSNHCRVRKGKSNMGNATEDYGIEVLTQVADMASVYPERYGHVEFYAPERTSDSVAIEALGGKVVGLAHGHQVSNPDRFPDFLAKQAAGRTPIGTADLVVFGHFHNLRIQTWGDDRWLFVAPTSDNGSAWWRNISGAESAPGVMAMTLDAKGWRDVAVL
ncbi:metallophosphoesterase family protein [Puerhibacterium puerhi]|uniref:hypothetical protein n=1 Tax=Puerhibacterium puerhi TaxID=2692623 RepID=UPI00135770B0|nr:hypothetical protein [Puerhibacterium puerhi]